MPVQGIVYQSRMMQSSLDMRRLFPQFYLLVNQANWENACLCLDDLQACIEQYMASCLRCPTEKIHEKIDTLRVSLLMPSVDYFKRKSVNSKTNDLVSSLIKIGVSLR